MLPIIFTHNTRQRWWAHSRTTKKKIKRVALLIAATNAICIKLHHWKQGVSRWNVDTKYQKCKLLGLEQMFSQKMKFLSLTLIMYPWTFYWLTNSHPQKASNNSLKIIISKYFDWCFTFRRSSLEYHSFSDLTLSASIANIIVIKKCAFSAINVTITLNRQKQKRIFLVMINWQCKKELHEVNKLMRAVSNR